MVYLDLVGYTGDAVNPNDGYVVQIDPENKWITLFNGDTKKVVVGASKPIVKTILNLPTSEMTDYIYNDAVVSGRALFEFMNSIFGHKFINPSSVSASQSVYSNVGGVGYIPALETKALVRELYKPKAVTPAVEQVEIPEEQVEENPITPVQSQLAPGLSPVSVEIPSLSPTSIATVSQAYGEREIYQIVNGKRLKFKIITGQPNPLVMTRSLGDVTYNIDGTIDTDNRTILDGPPDDIMNNAGVDDEFMSEAWDFCQMVDEELATIEAPEVLTRKADIRSSLASSIYTKNSVVTDICFITNLHLQMEGLSNYVTYIVADSESIVHSKTKEVQVDHQYQGVDSANGVVSITAYNDTITLTNYDKINSKPTKRPIIICEVYDMFDSSQKYATDVFGRHLRVIIGGEQRLLTLSD